MTLRAYGYVTGKEGTNVVSLVEKATEHFALCFRGLSLKDLQDFPDNLLPHSNSFCFELTDNPRSYTVARLLDPSDWDPFADIPISWKFSERLDAVITFVEFLFSKSSVVRAVFAMTEHRIEHVRYVDVFEFREVCLEGFEEKEAPNTLYVIEQAGGFEFQTEQEKSIAALFWKMKRGGQVTSEEVQWVIEQLDKDCHLREVEQALLLIGMTEAKEYRNIVESYLKHDEPLLAFTAFHVVWSHWKDYQKYKSTALKMLRFYAKDDYHEPARSTILEVAPYVVREKDAEMIREIFNIYIGSESECIQLSAYGVLRELVELDPREREEDLGGQKISGSVVEKIERYVEGLTGN